MTERGRGSDPQSGERRRTPGIIVALLAVGFLGLVGSQWRERQHVSSVVINGVTGLSGEAVRAVADTFQGRQIRTLDFAAIRDLVESLPYVKDASVHLTGVRDLAVDIVERQPIAHVVMEDGSLRYVDADGRVLPPTPVRTAHNVPVLQPTGSGTLTATELKMLATALVEGRQTLDASLFQSVSEVRLDRATHEIVVVTERSNWRMRSDGDVHRAFADMNVFWVTTGTRLDLAGVVEIDVRWSNQVVLRRSNT